MSEPKASPKETAAFVVGALIGAFLLTSWLEPHDFEALLWTVIFGGGGGGFLAAMIVSD